IIASDMGAVRPYVEDGVTGYLVGDLVRELPEVIARVEEAPLAAVRMGRAAHAKYVRCFARRSIAALFKTILLEAGPLEKFPCASAPPAERFQDSEPDGCRHDHRAIRA